MIIAFGLYLVYSLPVALIMIIIDKINDKLHFFEIIRKNNTACAILGLISMFGAFGAMGVAFLALKHEYILYSIGVVICGILFWFWNEINDN